MTTKERQKLRQITHGLQLSQTKNKLLDVRSDNFKDSTRKYLEKIEIDFGGSNW